MGAIQWASSDDEEFPDIDVVLALANKKARAQEDEDKSTRNISKTSAIGRKPPRRRNLELEDKKSNVSIELCPEASSGTESKQVSSRQGGSQTTSRRRNLNLKMTADNPLLRPLDHERQSRPEPTKTSRQAPRGQSRTIPTPLAFSSEDEDSFHDARSNLEPECDSDYEPTTNRKTRAFNGAEIATDLKGMEDGKKPNRSGRQSRNQQSQKDQSSSNTIPADSMLDALSRLDINSLPTTPPKKKKPSTTQNKTLVSPQKLPRIPKTPHRPSVDLFWDQQFVNEWNEEHSPKKLFLPPVTNSPVKSPRKAASKPVDSMNAKEAKKLFMERRHQIAEDMLRELDDTITQGQLSKLAASTGGIKIQWSKTLHTTAGRANWKRERIRDRSASVVSGKENSGEKNTDVAATVAGVIEERHHASIELAEKVIDDEHRLLNVIAHEFCHLANFMVTGITGNPHGKEFKAWAAKVSRAFGDRSIKVTTRHTYEIDFKYIWECTECGIEYKRHSKSLNIQRHRCGSCKSLLKQTKPVPRANTGKKSEYQIFMGEQMKLLKQENPGIPQKNMMKQVAEKWAARTGNKVNEGEAEPAAIT